MILDLLYFKETSLPMNETNHPFLVGSRGLTGSSSFSQASEIRTSAAPFSSTGATRRIFTPIQDISDTSEKKTGKLRLSFVTASDQEKFEELFRSAVGDSIVISGEIAKSIMSKSCLTPSVLSKIWEHADTTKSGQLMMPEFVLAMHLCNMAMSGKSVPDKIPDVIYDEVFDVVSSILLSVPDSVPSNINTTNLKTVSTSQHTASSLPTTQTVKPLQMSQTSVVAQAGGPQTHFLQLPTNFQSFSSSSNVRPPVHHTPLHYMESVEPSLTGVLNYPAQFKNIVSQEQWGIIDRNQGKLSGIDALQSQLMPRKGKEGFSALNLHANTQLTWAITKEEKQVYDNIFKAWDGYNIGFINGQTAVEIFSQSGLSKKDLELIWNLADSDNSGKLNIDEFSIALHLIYRKLNGYEIPLELPQELMLQSSKNFSESVNQVKSLLRDFNSQQKQSFSPNVTDYMKSSSPFINDPFQLYRKETSTYKYDDNKIGYIPVSRRKEPLKDFDSPFIHTEQKELLVQSNKNIKNKEGNLDITNIQNEKHELKIKNEIKHLYRQIRYIQEEIDNHPESSLLLYDLEEEHKTLTEELQDLSEELPSIISKIRKVEQEIANAKIELFKLRDAKNHPDSAEKFKNNKTANTDKRETKTAVILKAQMAILTGKSTLLEDNDYEKRYTEALFHINKERQSNENTISNIEESAEQLKNDLKSKLKDFQDKFLQNNYERKKWNKGIDIQNEEVRKFILDLEKTRESQEKKDLDHFKKNQFLDTSIEQSKVNPSKTEYSEFTYKNDTANAFISIDKNKDKAAWIKAEAERRMNERLAEMGIEPYKRSSRSDNFLTINKTQINDIKETEKKKENKELEKDTENSLGINKFKKIDMYQAQQNLTEDSALDQQSEILNEAFQKEKELLSEKEAQEERIKKLKVIKLKNVEKAYEIKRREKKHDLFEKEKKLRKLKEEMENKKQEELLLQRKQAEMEEEIKKLSLENEKYEIEENKNKLKADSIQTQHISRTNPFLQFSTSESFTSLNKPNNPFSNMQSHNKSNSSLNTLYTTSSVQLCSSPPIISVLKASHSDCQTDSNNWSTSQYTYESDSSDDSVIAKKSPAQLASILFGNIEANKKSPQASKSDISKSPITKLDMSPSPLPTPPPLPTNINSSSIVNRHALLNQIQKGTKLKKTPTIHPRSSSIVGKV